MSLQIARFFCQRCLLVFVCADNLCFTFKTDYVIPLAFCSNICRNAYLYGSRSSKLLSLEKNQAQNRSNDEVQSNDGESFWDGCIEHGGSECATAKVLGNHSVVRRKRYVQYVPYYSRSVSQNEPRLDLNEV